MVRTKRCAYTFAERFCGVGPSRVSGAARATRRRVLRTAVLAFVDHYHEERPHQGLNNQLIAPQITVIGRRPRPMP